MKQIIRRIFIFMALLTAGTSRAQNAMDIYGPTVVKNGEKSIYNAVLHIYDANNPDPDYCWNVSGGTYRIITEGCRLPGEPMRICMKCTAIEVTWTSSGPGLVGVSTASGYSASINTIIVTPIQLAPVTPATQHVRYNAVPASLSVPVPTGGDGTFTYTWQKLSDDLKWENISGATSRTYIPPASAKRATYRVAVSSYGATAYSRRAEIIVHKQLNAGEIFGYQRTAANGIANLIKGEPATGDEGAFKYQWQQSTDKVNWTNIAAATSMHYQPAPAAATRFYRRKVTSTWGTVTTDAYTNISVVEINNNLNANVPATTTPAYSQPVKTMSNLPSTMNQFSSTMLKEIMVLKPGVKDSADVASLPYKDAAVQKSWFDGLGRPVQQVDVQVTHNAKDLVHQTLYDDRGRSDESFMPYVDGTAAGSLRTDAGTKQQAFYKSIFPQENFFYSRVVRNADGDNILAAAPGNSYVGSNVGITTSSRALGINEQVLHWIMTDENTPALAAGEDRFYNPSEVTVQESADVYGNRNVVYIDRQGKKLMQKVENRSANTWLYTYNVYDDFGRLVHEITPMAVRWVLDNYSTIPAGTTWPLNETIRLNLCIGYKYDEKGRVVSRKDPGVEESEVVFDKKGRPVLTRTSIQRNEQRWSYMVYDALGHIIISGVYKNSRTRQQLQTIIDNAAVGAAAMLELKQPARDQLVVNRHIGRPVYEAKKEVLVENGFESSGNTEIEFRANPALQDEILFSQVMIDPDYLGLTNNPECTPLNINYYDSYDYIDLAGKAFDKQSYAKLDGGTALVNVTPLEMPRGLITGSKIRMFYPAGTAGPEWIATVNYYDRYGKIIQTIADNITGGTDVETSGYSYDGKLLSTHRAHSNPVASVYKKIELVNRYVYYDNGLLKERWQSFNNEPSRLLTSSTYNELGQTTNKVLGNGIESIDMTYDLNGMLKGINKSYAENNEGNHYFGVSLHHEKGYTNTNLDGKISGIIWRRKGAGDAAMSYGFQYDPFGRMKEAYFTQNKGGQWSQNEKNYTVDNLSYDEGGNILSMRTSASYLGQTKVVDNLTYTYDPNSYSLKKVTDLAGDNQQGDFKDDNSSTGDDYSYDENGSLITDANKKVVISWNNILEKPEKLVFASATDKWVKYIYDASGYRWKKIVQDGNSTSSYSYVGGFTYKNDSILLHFTNEGVRTRLVRRSLSRTYAFVNDYLLADHLGNIRTVLTEEKDTAVYAATYETARVAVEEAIFNNRTSTSEDIPTTYPFYSPTDNRRWSKLNGNDPTKRVGTSLVLKVMAGDMINVGTKAFYKQMPASNNGTPVNDMVSALINSMLGGNYSIIDNGHNNLVQSDNTILNTAAFNSFLDSRQEENNTPESYPKAYLSYVLFDEDFNMVSGNVVRINKGANALQDYSGYLDVPQNGYLYVYESNESPVDVWFDDLVVTHRNGPLLQENTIYPYGLAINSQSSAALMKAANYDVYQAKELDYEHDLKWNYFDARYYDPQLGRFISVDPGRQFANGYQSMGNNPAMFVDPDGRFLWIPVAIGAALGAFSGYSIAKAKGAQGFWEWFGYIGGGAVIGGASAWAGASVAGGINLAVTNGVNAFTHVGLAAVAAGGAVSGAVSGLGFGLLSGSDDLFRGTIIGAASGMLGSSAGAMVTGGAGALVGGFTGGVISSSLNGGGDFGSILTAGLVGGAMAWGVYQVNNSINYRIMKNALTGKVDLTRKQFNVLSRLTQKSFVKGKEFGGYLTEDGDIVYSSSKGAGKNMFNDPRRPGNAVLSFHTHPNNGKAAGWLHGHSDRYEWNPNQTGMVRIGDMGTDIKDGLSSIVISRSNVFYHEVQNMFNFSGIGAPFVDVSKSIISTRYFNPYPFSIFFPY
jgi:RHS repeat-associated protein